MVATRKSQGINAIQLNQSTIKAYFQQIAMLVEAKEQYPVNLDDVWPLVYDRKEEAVRAMKSDFMQVVDYQILRINAGNSTPGKRGRKSVTYRLTLQCFEFFIARKVRPVFNVYSEVLRQRIAEEKNPELAIDRAITSYKRKGKSDEWIGMRLKAKATRNMLTSTLKRHGVEHEGYRNVTNAVYGPLYGGSTNVVREKKGLDRKDSIRDNIPPLELSAIEFSEQLTSHIIESENLNGNAQCEIAALRASRTVAQALVKAKEGK